MNCKEGVGLNEDPPWSQRATGDTSSSPSLPSGASRKICANTAPQAGLGIRLRHLAAQHLAVPEFVDAEILYTHHVERSPRECLRIFRPTELKNPVEPRVSLHVPLDNCGEFGNDLGVSCENQTEASLEGSPLLD